MKELIVGHTKFSPDWCFGLIKQWFRRTNVSCLDDIAMVVDQSAKVNTPQLVGTQEGEILVPSYNWSEMLGPHFRKVKNIKTYHFCFDASMPGKVRVNCPLIVTKRHLISWSHRHGAHIKRLCHLMCSQRAYHSNDSGIYITILQSIASKSQERECARNPSNHYPPIPQMHHLDLHRHQDLLLPKKQGSALNVNKPATTLEVSINRLS